MASHNCGGCSGAKPCGGCKGSKSTPSYPRPISTSRPVSSPFPWQRRGVR